MYYLTSSVVQFGKLESCVDGTHAFQILPTTTDVLCPSSSALLQDLKAWFCSMSATTSQSFIVTEIASFGFQIADKKPDVFLSCNEVEAQKSFQDPTWLVLEG